MIAKVDYSHPVFTPKAWPPRRATARSPGVNRTHYCGAWWGWGFHEDGVVSALRALENVGGASALAEAA